MEKVYTVVVIMNVIIITMLAIIMTAHCLLPMPPKYASHRDVSKQVGLNILVFTFLIISINSILDYKIFIVKTWL